MSPIIFARYLPIRPGVTCLILGVAAWFALLESGVEPVVIGIAMGFLVYAFPAPRSNLERATERFREFREQPTAELARAARSGAPGDHVTQRTAAADCSTPGRAT